MRGPVELLSGRKLNRRKTRVLFLVSKVTAVIFIVYLSSSQMF